MRVLMGIAFALLAFISCETRRDSRANNAKGDNIVRSYFKDGKLKSEISVKHGLHDGLSKSYYANGKISLELFYQAGKRHGMSRRYYESGGLYQVTEYKDDKIDGSRKKYTKQGKLMSEESFVNNLPCNFLKEYLDDGSLRKGYPTIIIFPVDRLKHDGTYILKLSLSNHGKRVKYYKGLLAPSGCMTEYTEPLFTDSKTGIGQVRYYLVPGGFQMEELHIIAEITTLMGNTYLAQRSFNVSIEN